MPKRATVAALIAATEARYLLPKGSLVSKDRSQPLMSYRQLAMHLAREEGYEWSWIGRVFKRDRTTVSSNVYKARDNLRRGYPWWSREADELKEAWRARAG